MNAVRKNMKLYDVTEENAIVRIRWRKMICCGDPRKGNDLRERRKKTTLVPWCGAEFVNTLFFSVLSFYSSKPKILLVSVNRMSK